MAVLAIVTSSPPGVEGGHLVIARALVAAAREAGHDARLVVTPDYGFGRQARVLPRQLADRRRRRRVDQVISLRYPSYAVRHPAHVCWLNHTMREYYDLWPRFAASISARARVKERVRRALHARGGPVAADAPRHRGRRAVPHGPAPAGRRRSASAPTCSGRRRRQRAYRCDGYGDYIFAVSRLTPLKRLDLLVRALAEPAARQRARGHRRRRREPRRACERLAVDARRRRRASRSLGRVDDEQRCSTTSARCRAVCFPPLDEDYGFVTVEAFASAQGRRDVPRQRRPGRARAPRRDGLCVRPDAGRRSPAPRVVCATTAALAERLGARAPPRPPRR